MPISSALDRMSPRTSDVVQAGIVHVELEPHAGAPVPRPRLARAVAAHLVARRQLLQRGEPINREKDSPLLRTGD